MVASSKSRLESKFQSAIHRTKKTDSSNKFGSASDENGSPSYDSEADSTPPPITPKKAEPNSLKRSTSPNKKKLNTLLSEEKLSVVSSRSPKKDNSGDSGNGSISDLAQPAAPSLSRKTSVRNSASHFDSPSSEVSEDRAESPSREAKLRKDSKSEVIVVD